MLECCIYEVKGVDTDPQFFPKMRRTWAVKSLVNLSCAGTTYAVVSGQGHYRNSFTTRFRDVIASWLGVDEDAE